MQIETRRKILWTVGAVASLFVCYLLCRYTFWGLPSPPYEREWYTLVALHGMMSFPFYLLVFGLSVIAIAALCNGKRTMICTVSGYMIGFVLGALFNVDFIDEHGTSMDTFWIWWILTMLAFVSAGAIWDIAIRIARKLRERNLSKD